MIELEKQVTKIIIKRRNGNWKLTILGVRDGQTAPMPFFRARCADLDEVAVQLADWRKGLIIV